MPLFNETPHVSLGKACIQMCSHARQGLSIHKLIFKVDGKPQYETQADISLADTVEFQHVGKFFLVLSKPKKKNEERKIFPSKDNIIYARKKKSNYQLLFRFNEPINKKDSTIVFSGELIRHTVVPLLKD